LTLSFAPSSGVHIAHPLPSLHESSWVEAPVVIQASLAPNNLIQVGAFTGIYGGKLGHCKVGRYCSIAPGVDIASDQHPHNWLSSSMVQYVPDIHGWSSWLKQNGYPSELPINRFNSNSCVEIGNDVWIGQGVFIKSGVKIGDGAIVAAHSVVISDVPPYAIIAGVPAVVKRYRFDDSIIDKMTKIKWWEYNIHAVSSRIDFSNVAEALAMLEAEIEDGRIEKYIGPRHKLVKEKI
jgi:acetyltransferase-like isoleucine patch superfamily enzyme